MANTKVKVEMERFGEFVIELLPEYAPETAANFEGLVKEGFYDGVIFHRVIDDFMAQGGDPTGTGMGGSGKNIDGQYAAFGRVVEGMETIDAFLEVPRRGPEGGSPTEDIRIKKMSIL